MEDFGENTRAPSPRRENKPKQGEVFVRPNPVGGEGETLVRLGIKDYPVVGVDRSRDLATGDPITKVTYKDPETDETKEYIKR